MAKSIRNGPNGEFQLTPIPIEMRGLAELPRKISWNGGTVEPIAVLAALARQVGGVRLVGEVTVEMALGVQIVPTRVAASIWV